MKFCRLCEKRIDFADSHIIPRSFFTPLHEGKKVPQVVTDKSGVLPKRSPTGEYDPEILCNGCEPLFSEWDDYGKTILLDEIKRAEAVKDIEGLVAYRLEKINIPRLRMFLISVLWRAAVSGREFFEKIELGKFENIARNRILERLPGPVEEFGIIIAKWDDTWIEIVSNPYMTKIGGVDFAVIMMLDYVCYIKADDRNTPSEEYPFLLGATPDVLVLVRSFHDSQDREIISGLAHKFLK